MGLGSRRQVRRRAFDLRELPGLILWLRPETIGGYLHGGLVDRWFDSSGANNHGTNSGGSAPTKDITQGGGFGRGEVATFDGSSTFLDIPNITVGAPATFMAAVAQTGTPGGFRGILVTHALGLYQVLSDITSWGVYTSLAQGSGQIVASPPYVTSAVLRAVNDIDLVTNGTNLLNTTSGSGVQARGSTRLGSNSGGGQFYDGRLSEICMWDRALTQGERKVAEEYLYRRHTVPPSFALGAL